MNASADQAQLPVRYAARLTDLTSVQLTDLLERGKGTGGNVERATAEVIAAVRTRGDAALIELARRYDGAELTNLEVSPAACQQALADLDPALREALQEAARNIRAFHQAQLPGEVAVEVRPGVTLGRRSEPLGRVGVYVPGGRASYPSSVLMGVIPAKAAGVAEVIVCTPPAPGGQPPAMVLAACALAGADRVFASGGAGAVAAMALGTESVPRVNKVVGPGNAYVTEAKRQLNGVVAIDSPAGPSEVLVVADAQADPELVALELIAQAEHDPDAAAVLVTTSAAVASSTLAALNRLAQDQPRQAVVKSALASAGAVLTVNTLDQALEFANRYAPEHLLLMLAEPRAALPRVRNAGSVFLGSASSVVFGDYVTGANHTLPTGGLARAYSGLSTHDFLRTFTYQEVTPAAAAELAPVADRLASAEGLPGHAAAARARLGKAGNGVGTASVPNSDVAGAAGASVKPTATRAPLSPQLRPQFRPNYRNIELYDPRRSPVEVDLSDNTNLFEPHPAVAEALRSVRPEQVSRYPSVYATELRQALADLHGVEPENITTGGGLDGVIDAAVRAFCEPGAVLAYPDPTFGMVALFGQMNGVKPVPVPLTETLDPDVDALLATRAALTYVCDPNNPTGKRVKPEELARLAAASPGVVLVDEAYADFAGLEPSAPEASNVLLLRTLSKAYGLAGLRVGYAVGPADLVREVEKSRGPYKVTASAEAAALAVLRGDPEWVRSVVSRTVANRERLTTELAQRGLRPLPSAANFVLVPVDPASGVTAEGLGARLRDRGVAVRVFPNLSRVGPAIRVSVGPWPMLERFLAELDAVLKDGAVTTRAGA